MSFDAGKIEGTIDLDRSPFEHSLDAAEERARRFAEQRYTPRIDLNNADVDRQFQEITDRLRRLGTESGRPVVNVDTTAAEASLDRVKLRLDELDGRVARPRVDLDDTAASVRLGDFFDRLERVDRFRATPRVDLNGVAAANLQLTELQARLAHLNGQTATVNTRSSNSGSGGIPGLPGLGALGIGSLVVGGLGAGVPILATLTAGVATLGAAFTGAAAGAVLFGAVAKGQLGGVTDARKKLAAAELQYTNAVTDKQRQAALLKEQQILDQLNPSQKALVVSLAGLSSAWASFGASVRPQIFDVATRAVSTLRDVLPSFQPLLKGAAGAFDTLAIRAQAAVQGPAFKSFTDFLTRIGPGAILTFGHVAADLGSTIGQVFQAFEPLIKPAEQSLTRFFDNLRDKAASLGQSAGFQQLLAFIQRTGPLVAQALGALGGGILGILRSAEPLAQPVLGLLTTIGNVVRNLADSGALAGLAGSLGKVVTSVGRLLQTLSDTQAIRLFTEALSGLASAASKVIDALGSVFRGAQRFGQWIGGSDGIAGQLGTGFANQFLDAFGNGIASSPAIGKIRDNLVKQLDDINKKLFDLGGKGQLGSAIGKQLQAEADAIKAKLADLGRQDSQSYVDAFLKALAASHNVFNQIFPGSASNITDVAAQQGAAVGSAWQAGMVTSFLKARQSSQLLFNLIFPTAEDGKSKAAALGASMGVSFAEPFTKQMAKAALVFNRLFHPDLLNRLAADAGAQSGAAAGAGLVGGLKATSPAVAAASRGLQSTSTSALGSGLTSAASGIGTAGGTSFWQALRSQTAGASSASRGLSGAARAGLPFNGAAPGASGGSSFWQGIRSQIGGASAAGGALRGAATGGLSFNAYQLGSSLGNSYAAGLASAAAAAGAAAAAIASSARAFLPSSPAKRGPFSGADHPEALGRRLTVAYAAGIRSGISHVAASSSDLAYAARIGAWRPGTGGPGASGGYGAAAATRPVRTGPLVGEVHVHDSGVSLQQTLERAAFLESAGHFN